jgi:hypothetical protein
MKHKNSKLVKKPIVYYTPDLRQMLSSFKLASLPPPSMHDVKTPLIGLGLFDTISFFCKFSMIVPEVTHILCYNEQELTTWEHLWGMEYDKTWKNVLYQEIVEFLQNLVRINNLLDNAGVPICRALYCNADFVHLDPVSNKVTPYVVDASGRLVDTYYLQVR